MTRTFHASSYQLKRTRRKYCLMPISDFLPSGTSKPPIVLPVDKVGLEVLLPFRKFLEQFRNVRLYLIGAHLWFQCDGENRSDIPELLQELSEVQSHTQLKCYLSIPNADSLPSETLKQLLIFPADKVRLEVLLPKVLGAVPECRVVRNQSPALVSVCWRE